MIRFYHMPRWLRFFYPQVQFTLEGEENEIALTFDDGPDPAFTLPILDILDHYRVKATFFMEGAKIEKEPDLAAEVARQGHGIGNHFYSHNELIFRSKRNIQEQLDRTDRLITEKLGTATALVRPPFGRVTLRVTRLITRAGMRTVLWSVMPYDFTDPGPETIAARTIQYTRSGSIIVLHDGGSIRTQTVEALPRIIETLSPRFAFARLDQEGAS